MIWYRCFLCLISIVSSTNWLLYFDPSATSTIETCEEETTLLSTDTTTISVGKQGCHVQKGHGSCGLLIPSSTGSKSLLFDISATSQFVTSEYLHYDSYAVIVEPKNDITDEISRKVENCLAIVGDSLCQPSFRNDIFDQYTLLRAAILSEPQCETFNTVVWHLKFPLPPKISKTKNSTKRKRNIDEGLEQKSEEERTKRRSVEYGEYVPSLLFEPRSKEKILPDLSIAIIYGDQVMLKSGVGPYIFLSRKIGYVSTVLDMRTGRVIRIVTKQLRKCTDDEAIHPEVGVSEDFTIKYILPKSPVLVMQDGSIKEGKLCALNANIELPMVWMQKMKIEVEWANIYPTTCKEGLMAKLAKDHEESGPEV